MISRPLSNSADTMIVAETQVRSPQLDFFFQAEDDRHLRSNSTHSKETAVFHVNTLCKPRTYNLIVPAQVGFFSKLLPLPENGIQQNVHRVETSTFCLSAMIYHFLRRGGTRVVTSFSLPIFSSTALFSDLLIALLEHFFLLEFVFHVI